LDASIGFSAGLHAEDARVTHTSLRLRQGMRFDAWLRTGRRLSEFSSASAWWLGDWLLYGQRTFSRRYEEALKATSLDYQTLRNYAWVARRFEPSRRRDTLSFQHHAEVAALPEAHQDLWLQRCERLRWSRNELRTHLREARRAADAASAECAVLRLEVPAGRERRWREAAAASGQPLHEWLAATLDTAADELLAPAGPVSPRRRAGTGEAWRTVYSGAEHAASTS
jgi:hypothetical protein